MANIIRTAVVESVVKQCGDNLWGECSQYPLADWRQEVENHDTVLGYWEWCVANADADTVDLATLTNRTGNAVQCPIAPPPDASNSAKVEGYDRAQQFMKELLDSVETLSGIADEHGARTLADLMFLHSAILSGGFVDHYIGESAVLEIASELPSGQQWGEFIKVEFMTQPYSDQSTDLQFKYKVALAGHEEGSENSGERALVVGSDLDPDQFIAYLRENNLMGTGNKGLIADVWPITVSNRTDFSLPVQLEAFAARLSELNPLGLAKESGAPLQIKDLHGKPVSRTYLERLQPLLADALHAEAHFSQDDLEKEINHAGN